jgi:NAD-dependent DNA ligase
MSLSTKHHRETIRHWFSPEVAGFTIPDNILSKLIQGKRVSSIADVYRMEPDSFKNLNKVKPSQAIEIVVAINAHREISLGNLIYGLKIPGMLHDVCMELAQTFEDFGQFHDVCFQQEMYLEILEPYLTKDTLVIDVQHWYSHLGKEVITEILSLVDSDILKVVNQKDTKLTFDMDNIYIKGHFKGITQMQLAEIFSNAGARIVFEIHDADVLFLGSRHGIAFDDIPKKVKVFHDEEVQFSEYAEAVKQSIH